MPRRIAGDKHQRLNALDFYTVYSVLFEAMRFGDITPRDVLLATAIHHLDHSREGGESCTASNRYFSDLLGVDPNVITKGIGRLEAFGFINIVRIDQEAGNKRFIESGVLDMQYAYAKSLKGRQKQPEGLVENNWGSGTKHLDGLVEKTQNNIRRGILEGNISKSHSLGSAEPRGRGREKEVSAGKKERARRRKIYRPLTEKLAEIIKTRRKIVQSARLFTWDDSFRGLVELDGVPIEKVEVVLDLYGRIFGDDYVPVAWSAKAFRAKFNRIEAAIERKGAGAGRRKPRRIARKPGRRVGG